MTERQILVAAAVAAIAAAVGWAWPWWALAAVSLVWLVSRRPIALILLLAAIVGSLAARSEAGLTVEPGRRVSGVASVLTDPEDRPGGLVVELRLDGTRYRSFVDGGLAPTLRRARVGQEVDVVGRTSELRGPWEWRASRHLAGQLRLTAVDPVRDGAWWWRSANWMHRTVESGLGSFDPDERALFLGVVFGDDRGQSEVERFRFRASGLSHLMAVSGQNVAFVLVAAGPLLTRLRLGVRWSVTLLVLVWFALVTRLEPSVLRAVAMALVAATAAWRGRYASGLRIVGVAVVGLLVIDPLLVWSTGFRLSVAASLSLVVLSRPLTRRIPGPRVLAEVLAASLAAQVGTAPLLLVLSGSVPAFGPVFNLLAVPVAGWLMVWGVVTGPIAGVAGGPVASAIGWPSRWMLRWLAWVAEVGSAPDLPRIAWVGVGATAVLVVVVAFADERRSLLRRAVVIGSLVALPVDVAVLGGPPAVVDTGALRAWTAGANVVLLGPGADERDVLASLLVLRVGRVDVVIVAGRSATSSRIVWALRQVVDIGTVLAADPSTIRDAVQLDAGPVVVGGETFMVERGDEGFAVSGPV